MRHTFHRSAWGRQAVAWLSALTLLISFMMPGVAGADPTSSDAPVEDPVKVEITAPPPDGPPGEKIIVRRKPTASAMQRAMTSARADGAGEAGLELVTLASGESVGDALAALRADPDVLYAEPNYVRTLQVADPPPPNDTYASQQWGLASVRATSAWAYLQQNPPAAGTSVTVAVVDTGIDLTHGDFDASRILPGRSFAGGVATNLVTDDHGHGTFVSGIIAATANNARGIAGVSGIWPVKILPVKVLDATGAGTVWDVASGIRWAADNGAKVINLSFGGFGYSQTEADAVAYARQMGAVVVAAVGNGNTNADGFFPAAFPGVVGVGAVDTNPIHRASFSNYGSALDIMAPGVGILSTIPAHAAGANCQAPVCYSEAGAYYAAWNGTSAAAPFVSAAAALLLAKSPAMTEADLQNTLLATAEPLGTADQYGHGLLQIGSAFGLPRGSSPDPQFVTPSEGAELWGIAELRVAVANPEGVDGVLFNLDGLELAKVTHPESPQPYQSVYRWDTTAVAEGSHVLTAQVFATGADGLPALFGSPVTVHVTVRRQFTDGLRLQVLHPDGAAASLATVTVFHRAPSVEPGVPYWYEPVFQGTTDAQGSVVVPSSFATEGNDYTVVTYAQTAAGQGVVYTARMRSPGQLVLGGVGVAAQRVDLSARSRERTPLAGAEAWIAYSDENGVRLPYPLPAVRLSAQGTGTVYLSEGQYDVHVRDTVAHYFLTEKNVSVIKGAGEPTKVAFEPSSTNTARLTVGMPGAYQGKGYLYLWEPDFLFAYAIPVAQGESVVVSNVAAKVVGRLWLNNVAGTSWSYLVESLDVMSFASGDQALTIGRNLRADVDLVDTSLAVGQTLSAGVRFYDDGGFFMRDVQFAPGSISMSVQGATIAVRQPGTDPQTRAWDSGNRTWVGGEALAPHALASPAWQFVDPKLTISRLTAQGQQMVYENSRFEFYHTVYWQVLSDISAGAYVAGVSLNTGPLGAIAGSADFLVEAERPAISVTAPDGKVAAGAYVRLLALNGATHRWDLAFNGRLDATGRILLPDGFQLESGRQHLVQVEGDVEAAGLLQPFGLQRSVSSLADLSLIDGRSARPVRIHATFADGQAMPGAALLAQPAPAGSAALPSEQRPAPLSMGMTGAGGVADVWLDPGEYSINGTFSWTTVLASEGYWLLTPASVPATGAVAPVRLKGEETGIFRVTPGAHVHQMAVAMYTDKVYSGMSFPFGPSGGNLYVTPDAYKPYAIVTQAYADAYWNQWVKLTWADPTAGTTVGPRTTPTAPDVHQLTADGALSVGLTLLPQDLVPGFSTLRGDVVVADGAGNRVAALWVELRAPDRGMQVLEPGRPPTPGPTVQNHWETVPFLTVTPHGSSTEIAHLKSDAHFTSIAWPVPTTIANGDYDVVVSLQSAPGVTVASPARTIRIGQEGISITTPTVGQTFTVTSFTVAGRAPIGAAVTLMLAKGSQPVPADFHALPTVTATKIGTDTFGTWQVPVSAIDGDGAYTFYAVIPLSGTEIASERVTVSIDTATPGAPALTVVALSQGEVRLTWTGEPGKATEQVLVYRVEASALVATLPATPTWTLPAASRSYIDREVAPDRSQTFTYWVAYRDAVGNDALSNSDDATTPGLFLDVAQNTAPLKGWIDLKATVEETEQVKVMRFSLVTGGTASPIASVTAPQPPGVYRHVWDTTQWPDGAHRVRVESFASLTALQPIATVETNVTIANERASGLAFSVRNPDKTVAAGAVVGVWALQTGPNGPVYESLFQGTTDAHGMVVVPGSQVPDLEPHLVSILSSQTDSLGQTEWVQQVLTVTGPTTRAVGAEAVRRVALTATDRSGTGLSGAEVWPVLRDGAGVALPLPTVAGETTRPNGQWVGLISPGTYDFYVRHSAQGYYLYERGVTVGTEPVALAVSGAAATRLTAAWDPGNLNLAGQQLISLQHPAGPAGSANVLSGRDLTVSAGSYGVNAAVSLPGAPGVTWLYSFASTGRRTVSGPSLNLLVGGAMTASVAPEAPQYLPGADLAATVAIDDAYGFRLTSVATTAAVFPLVTIAPLAADVPVGYDRFTFAIPAASAAGTRSIDLVLEAGPLGRITASSPVTIGTGTNRVVEVRSPLGDLVDGAKVWLLDRPAGGNWQTLFAGQTGPDGQLTISPAVGVTDGQTYLLQATFPYGAGTVGVSREVAWTAGQPMLPLTTDATSAITLQALLAGGAPLAGARVGAQPLPAGYQSPTAANLPPGLDLGSTGAAGSIVLYLDPGEYHLTAASRATVANGQTAHWLIAERVDAGTAATVTLDGALATAVTLAPAGLDRINLVLFHDQIHAGVALPFGAAGGVAYLSPGAYRLYAESIRVTAEGSWHYWQQPADWSEPGRFTAASGAALLLRFAAPDQAEATVLTPPVTWQPGETVQAATAFVDAYGNRTRQVWASSCVGDLCASALYAIYQLGGPRFVEAPANAGLVEVQRTQQITPLLTVALGGSQISQAASPAAFAGHVTWTVPDSALPGTYTLRLELQVGPEGTLSAEAPFTVGSLTPAILSPVSGGRVKSTQVDVSGRAPAGWRVTLQIRRDGSTANTQWQAGVTTASADGLWTLTAGLPTNDGLFVLHVVAESPAHLQLTSDPIQITVDTRAPTAPVLTGTALDYKSVRLAWTGEPGESLARVLLFRREGPASGQPTAADLLTQLDAADRTYVDGALKPKTLYTYWVGYEDLAGNLAVSPAAAVTTQPGIEVLSAHITTERSRAGQAFIGNDLRIEARGTAGHVAQALAALTVADPATSPESIPVLLTEVPGLPGTYRGVLRLDEGMQRINAITVTMTHATDPNLHAPDLLAPGLPVPVGGGVEGQVSVAGGAPIAGLPVTAWSPSRGSGGQTHTDASGHYRIDGLAPAADYVVRTDPTATGTRGQTGPVPVEAGLVHRLVDVAVVPTYSLTVPVFDKDNASLPVPGIGLVLVGEAAGYYRRAVTGAGGEAVFLIPVGAGTFHLYTEHAGAVGYLDTAFDPLTVLAVPQCGADALVRCLPKQWVSSRATRTGGLSGIVQDDLGTLLDGVSVTVRGADQRVAALTRTDSLGRFTVDGLAAGSYELTFAYPTARSRVLSNVPVAGGPLTPYGTVVLQRGGQVRGIVMAGAVAAAAVNVKAEGPAGPFWAQSGPDGHFAFAQLPAAGTYTLTTHNGDGWLDASAPSIDVGRADVVLTLAPGASIRGTVGGLSTAALAHTLVETTLAGGRPILVHPDAAGNFRIDGLAPGAHDLLVTAPGAVAQVVPGVIAASPVGAPVAIAMVSLPANPFTGTGNQFRAAQIEVAPGGSVDFKAGLMNRSSIAISDVALWFQIPSGMVADGAGIRIVGRQQPTLLYPAPGPDGRRFVRFFIGTMAAGESLTVTYRLTADANLAEPAALNVAAEVVWLANPATDQYARTLLGQASVSIEMATISGPAATPTGIIRVQGTAPPGATVWVLANDGTVLGQTLAVGRLWSAQVTLPAGQSQVQVTARAVRPGLPPLQPSEPLVVHVLPNMPAIDTLTLTAGSNGTLTASSGDGALNLAAAERTPMTMQVAFHAGAPVATVRARFTGVDYSLAPRGGGVYQLEIPDSWTGSGIETITLLVTDTHAVTYSIPAAHVLTLIDPSGYAYELFPSVRLAGVTATLEQKVGVQWVAWDAAAFGQQNPQITDANGRYGWDVPAGQWRVIFTKTGYEPFISESVSVPPPKTDLNPSLLSSVLPIVSSATPAAGASVSVSGATVSVTFSKYMKAGTLTTATVSLTRSDGTAVAAAIGLIDPVADPRHTDPLTPAPTLVRTVHLTPAAQLDGGVTYTVSIDSLVEDYAGYRPAAAQTWNFTTTTTPVIPPGPPGPPPPPPVKLPPSVAEFLPQNGAQNVPVDTAIVVRFAAALKESTLTDGSVRLLQNNQPIAVTRTYDPTTFTVTLRPATALTEGLLYSVLVASGLESATGGVLIGDIYAAFNTVKPLPPELVEQRPVAGAKGVPVTSLITFRFKAGLKSTSVNNATVQLLQNGRLVPAIVTYTAATFTVTLKPLVKLAEGTTYTATLSTGLSTTKGGVLASPLTATFTTYLPEVLPTHLELPTAYGLLAVDIGPDGTAAIDAVARAGALDLTNLGPTLVIDLSQPAVAVERGGKSETLPVSHRSITFDAALLTQLADAGKTVTIITGDARLTFSPLAFTTLRQVADTSGGAGMRVRIELNPADQQTDSLLATSLRGLGQGGTRLAGPVLSLKALLLGGPDSEPIEILRLGHPVNLTLSYEGSVNTDHLGIYRLNRATGQWEFRGGQADAATRTVAAELLSFSEYAPLLYTRRFTDLPESHWAFGDVMWMASRTIIRGMSDTEFAPAGSVTRAQMAALLVRALGLPVSQVGLTRSFGDVAPGAWYFAEVEAAVRAGLMKGDGSQFRPDAPITRQEMAVVLIRAVSQQNPARLPSGAEAEAALAAYADLAALADWARADAGAAAALGLIRGRTESTWNPTERVTRAEAAVMLRRLLTLLAK